MDTAPPGTGSNRGMTHVADSMETLLLLAALPRLSVSHAVVARKTGRTPTGTEENVKHLRQLSSLSSKNPRMLRKSRELLIDLLALNRPVSFSIIELHNHSSIDDNIYVAPTTSKMKPRKQTAPRRSPIIKILNAIIQD